MNSAATAFALIQNVIGSMPCYDYGYQHAKILLFSKKHSANLEADLCFTAALLHHVPDRSSTSTSAIALISSSNTECTVFALRFFFAGAGGREAKCLAAPTTHPGPKRHRCVNMTVTKAAVLVH